MHTKDIEINNRLSFIIPAYNEEKNIVTTLIKIREQVPDSLPFEIIVVDHGSTDKTVETAANNGAKTFVKKDTTIAGLRNYGVERSTGDVLIFLDADVKLTPSWRESIEKVIEVIRKGERILTGSWYSVPSNPTWIEKRWFEPQQKIENTHINSGHMIISRQLFDELEGFTEHLETGEDYDISMRAELRGIKIIDNKNLVVIHEGYPKSLRGFIKREYWHGKGDSKSLSSILQSKIALFSLLFLFMHLIFLTSVLFRFNTALVMLLFAVIIILPVMASIKKYKNENIDTIIINAFLYYVYFWARTSSIINVFINRKIKKRQR